MTSRLEHPLHEALGQIVGAEQLVSTPEVLANYSQDKSPFPPLVPAIVVRPGSVNEVRDIMRLAGHHKTPVNTRGGGFSLTGYLGECVEDTIVLDLRRLNRVLDIDAVNFTATAQCGIIMKDLSDQVEAAGLHVHTVGIPIGYTTLGGVLSGVQGGGYPASMCVSGTGLYHLLGLEMVLPSGELLRTNAGGANVHRSQDFTRGGNAPDLTSMFVGDGGCFGIKTEACVRIHPRPQEMAAGCFDFDDFDCLWAALLALTALPELPYESIVILESRPWSLFYFARGTQPTILDQTLSDIEAVLSNNGGRKSPPALQEQALDVGAAEPAYQDLFVNVDRGLLAFVAGKKEFPSVFKQVRELLDREIESRGLDELGVGLMVYFSPMLRHSIYTTISIIFDVDEPGSREAALDLQCRGYEKVVALGACPEPHQGYSSTVNASAWSPEFRQLMAGIKQMLDPERLLNRGLWGL